MRNKILFGIVFIILISLANAVEFEIPIRLSLAESLGLEPAASPEKINEKIKSNIIEQTRIIDSNQDQLLDIIRNWEIYSDQDIIIILSRTNEDLKKLNSWLRILKYAEDKKHRETQTILRRFLDWLGFYDKAERIRYNNAISQIENIAAKSNKAKDISNQVIQSLITQKSNEEYNKLNRLTNSIAELISAIGNLTNLDYIDLYEGLNSIILPKQPTNTSIEFVTGNISGKFTRIDYYDPESQTWLIYVPGNPRNTLHELIQNKVYWIYVNQDTRVHIK